jgi:NADH:ubiquinone oxidoreductase subunit 5 (subunit L)/multisubunit Na+/H+ antiporter MnhA subunit
MEKSSTTESTRVFFLNKLSSIFFLVAIVLIATDVNSLEFNNVQAAYKSIESYPNLRFSVYLLLASCLCKGAQLPFSSWIISATKANIYVSVLLHTVTIVGIGIIFITKCYFIFDAVALSGKIMIVVGFLTAIWMGLSSVFHVDIKKIIAASTASSVGFMFIASGLGEYSTSLLYFVCHAFFKTIFFLSFAYVVYAVSGETNVLKMGGVKERIPNIVDLVWVSFLSTIGFPFFVSFFAKTAFFSSIFYTENKWMLFPTIFINIISIISFLRLIMLSIHGKTRMDSQALLHIKDITGKPLAPPWLFITIAVFGSFIAWSMYEWQVLHFGAYGIVYSRAPMEYIWGCLIEIMQVIIAILFVSEPTKSEKNKTQKTIKFVLVSIFKDNMISDFVSHNVYVAGRQIIKLLTLFNRGLNKAIDSSLSKFIELSSDCLCKLYKDKIVNQTYWVFLGIILCMSYIVLQEIYGI